MAGFRIDFFKGMRPRISAKKLAPGEAQTAQNIDLGSGDILPFYENSTIQAATSPRQPRTIYYYDNDDDPLWLEWDDYVDVVPGPIKDDSLQRIYYVGDTTGNGAPKLTSNTICKNTNNGPYPEGWLYIGVPAPTVKPTVRATDLPEDNDSPFRLARDFKTDEFEIDIVEYLPATYPGTGTDNDTWRLNASNLGPIKFDVLLGTAFRVTEVINNNRVKIESATEPGITMRTINSDRSTINDYHWVDEQGSTKEAYFMGWRVPSGMQISVAGHNLNVGDVMVVSSINGQPGLYINATDDLYAQEWDTEVPAYDSGTTYYRHTNERISASATSGDTQFDVYGTFYYEVDRASSTSSELEDRTYVYTYVNSFGEEGPPSPPSDVTPCLNGDDILISAMALPPTIGYDITKMRLYRTNSTEAGTEYQFVKEFDLARSTRDTVLSEDLGEVIASTAWDGPPAAMEGLASMPNGMLVGFKGKNLYFCEPYRPHAWPAEYDRAVDYDIVGIVSFGNSVAVMTKGWPYIVSGAHPRNVNVKPIKVNQACSNRQSIATDGNTVYYASPDGIVEIDGASAKLATEQLISKREWGSYQPSTMVSGFYEGKYYGFYDFDVTSVDPLITAELSGTVTSADEDDIIEDTLTLLITLQNDQWVAAGTAFDNQRANIIAGLDCATGGANGWNAKIRDDGDSDGLKVADVVRTSDTVVTVTLTPTANYAITSDEVITCTIPNTALVLSGTDVVAGSTFTIRPQEHVTTVTLSGTLDGGAEATVVSGGYTIIMTLTNDTWLAVADGFNDYRQELINNLVSSTDEPFGWNDTVPDKIAVSSVVRTDDTTVTITLPAVAEYSVTDNESISATVPHEMLVTKQNIDVPSANSLGIIATGAPAAIFSGTAVSGGVTENEIVAGGETIIITLTNETWVAAGTGPIGTTAQSDALIDAIISAGSATNGWNNEVLAVMDQTDLIRTSDTVATITMPAVPDYSIASSETISCTIPSDVLTGGLPLGMSNTFSVTAQAPVTCALDGTVTGTIDKLNIQAGGETITLTVSDDTWVASGATFDAQRQNIINGLTASTSPTNGWNNVVRDVALQVTDVVRTSNTLVTITLPAAGTYDSGGIDEVITATVPATALNISASAVVADPTFTVLDDIPATIAVTGTADGATNDDIISGGKTIILTVSDDTWVASGATFNAIRQDIIDGLDAASSPTNGWNNEVRDVMAVTSVVRTSSTVVTITLPATADYDINADEVITVTVPASALTDNTSPVVGDVTVDITATSTSVSRMIAFWYRSPNYTSGGRKSYYDLNHWYARDNTLGITPDYYPAQAARSSGDSIWAYGLAIGNTDSIQVGLNVASASTSDPLSLTSRTSQHLVSQDSGGCIYYSTTFDYFFRIAGDDHAEYSTNGTTWTSFTSALENPVTTPDFSLTKKTSERNQVMYGGSTYVYAVVHEGSGSRGNALVRSADLTGANTPATNWTSLCSTTFSGGENTHGGFGTGNGLILHIGYNGVSDTQALEYMAHGGTSFTGATGSGLPSVGSGLQSATPNMIRFGNDAWLAMNDVGQMIRCDINGGATDETDTDNWTTVTDLYDTSIEYKDLWYDAGTTGSNGLGWIAVGYDAAADEGYIYQSADGSQGSWTLVHTETGLETESMYTYFAFPENPIDGTDLD